ncbi:MAG: toll/interleukin-1 receptor domain-containing protein [Pseudomonadota bacterium]
MSIRDDDTLETATSGNIFISYNRGDRDFRSQLEQLLIDEGYNPEYDLEGIASGEAWQARLEEMIGACDTFLVILTAEWAGSENCRKEFKIAENKRKRMIPVLPRRLADGVDVEADEAEIRAALSKLNYIHFFPLQDGDGGGFYRGMGKLKKSLRDDLVQLRLRRRYEARAKGWRAGEDDLLSGEQLDQALSWIKKEEAVEGVAPLVAEYIEESRKARIAAERAQRRNKRMLIGLVSAAVIASGAAAASWSAALNQQRRAEVVEEDAKVLSEAAVEWGRIRVDLERGLSTALDQRAPFEAASDEFDVAFNRVSEVGQSGRQRLLTEIGFDLARAHYNLNDRQSSRGVLETVRSELSDDELASVARYAMALALLDCRPDAAVDELELGLRSFGDTVQAQMDWDIAAQWSAPHPICSPARDAICRIRSCNDEVSVGETIVPVPVGDAPSDEVSSGTRAPRQSGTRSLSLPPPPTRIYDPEFKVSEVFLHISKEEDRAAALALSEILAANGYRVLGIELIPSTDGLNRSVRYYHGAQEEEAEDLRALCAEGAAPLGKAAWADESTYRMLSLEGRYEGLPKNRIEIWL